MKSLKLLGIILVLACLLVFVGCPIGGDGGDGGDGGTVIIVDQDINGAVTWITGNTYHVTDNIYVNGNLTIQAGVTIKFDSQIWMDVASGATLTANGLSGQHIVFTSATTQSPGAWAYLYLESGSNATTLNYCDFSYAGYGNSYAIYFDVNSRATITNCSFFNNLMGGIDASHASGGTSTMTGNSFYSNGDIPVIISDSCAFNSTNSFHKSGQAISYFENCIRYWGDITGSKTFDVTEVPYYFDDNFYLYGNLTINPGVVLKFGSQVWMSLTSTATLNAVGISGSPIIFTSYKDDSTKGDTNGDGATTGAKGDWCQLFLEAGSTAATLKYCTIMYGGYTGEYVIYFDVGSRSDIDYCTITHNLAGGIDAYWATGVTTNITNSVFSDNTTTGSGPYDINIDGHGNVSQSGNTYEHIKL